MSRSDGKITVDENRLVAETKAYRIEVTDEWVTKIVNKLTDEVYLDRAQDRTSHQSSALIYSLGNGDLDCDLCTSEITMRQTSPRSATLSAKTQAGGLVVLDLEIEAQSGDLVVGQRGEGRRKGLARICWGLSGFDSSLALILPCYNGLQIREEHALGKKEYFQWPMRWEAQLGMLASPVGGLCFKALDTDARFKGIAIDRLGSALCLGLDTDNTAPFDNRREIQSVKWCLNVYQGDWQGPAQRYKQWMEQAYSPAPHREHLPDWVADISLVVCWTPLHIVALENLARFVSPAKTLLHIPYWRKWGYDRNYPEYSELAPDFVDFSAAAKRLGYRTMLHFNLLGVSYEHPLYEELKVAQMVDPFRKTPIGWEWHDDPTMCFAYISPAYRPWRELLIERILQARERTQPDAIFVDQTLVAVNDDNGLHEGRNSIQGNLAFHQELRDAVPDIVLAGEGLNEVTFQHESFAQAHIYGCYYDRALRNWALAPDVIPMIHPINSFLFEPHCRLTGYANCDGSNPHSNWILEAYERMGVLPTISTPDPPPGENMLANPNPALRRVFQMANGTLVG